MISINEMPINITMFPDKTSQVWKLHEPLLNLGSVHIHWDFANEAEIIHLAQLRDLLRAYGNPVVTLHLDYLPYGRQDKRIHNESTFALKSFAKIINDMDFELVSCCDPHSEKAEAFIKNFEARYPIQIIDNAISSTNAEILAYPDVGAWAKYSKYFPILLATHAKKTRDQSTGLITSMELYSEYSVKGKRVLIIDDICDGGATFVALANKLYEAGATNVDMFVSHGIFSKGIDVLREAKIQRIFTKDGEQP